MASEIASWAARELGDEPEVDVPNVEQAESGTCGLAALRAVLLHFGIDAREEELKAPVGWSPEAGSSLQGLANAAQGYGLRAEIKTSASLDDLQAALAAGHPVIVAWFSTDDGHFSVVERIAGDEVDMLDVETGQNRLMPVDEFQRVWFDFAGRTDHHEGLVDRGMLVLSKDEGSEAV